MSRGLLIFRIAMCPGIPANAGIRAVGTWPHTLGALPPSAAGEPHRGDDDDDAEQRIGASQVRGVLPERERPR